MEFIDKKYLQEQAENSIKESVDNWLKSFVATNSTTTKDIIDNFYNYTSIPPADSAGYFYHDYLTPLIGKPINIFLDSICKIKVRIDGRGLYHLFF